MTNPITYKTALEIASHEALIRQAYKDSVGAVSYTHLTLPTTPYV